MATRLQLIKAWSVHIFTSLGLLAAFMALMAVDNSDWRACFIWLLVSFVIDSLDGSLARKFEVDTFLPNMDGKNIDFVVDFITYALIPTFFMYKAQMVEEHFMLIAVSIMLLSSALYYGKKGMVEDEQFFIGFPVLWNFVIFFQFFIVQNNRWVNICTVVLFGILHFVPIKFAYPSREKKYLWSHAFFSIIGLAGAVLVIHNYPIRVFPFEICCVIGALYFLGFAVYDTIFRKN